MSDATRTADPKSQRRGLESGGENPSEPADVLDAIDMVLEAWIDIENVQRVRDGLLRVFTEQQLVVVKAPGLSHGDELVRVDGLRVTGTQDAPTFNQEPVWRRLRRSVPENGERPHTHTRGIDRGDCPECDAEYGDTDG